MIWKLSGDQHVVYTSATTAWLFSNDLFGKLTASLYQTLTAGVHLGGIKLVRGYIETTRSKAQDKDMSEAKQTTVIAEKDVNEDAIESPAVQMEKEMEQYYDDEDRTRF